MALFQRLNCSLSVLTLPSGRLLSTFVFYLIINFLRFVRKRLLSMNGLFVGRMLCTPNVSDALWMTAWCFALSDNLRFPSLKVPHAFLFWYTIQLGKGDVAHATLGCLAEEKLLACSLPCRFLLCSFLFIDFTITLISQYISILIALIVQ